MAIRVECPKCHQMLEAPDEIAGRTAICPACRTKVQIPTAPASASPAPVPAPNSLAAKPRPTRPIDRIESIASDIRTELRTIKRRLGCLAGLLVVIAIIGIVTAIVLYQSTATLGIGNALDALK